MKKCKCLVEKKMLLSTVSIKKMPLFCNSIFPINASVFLSILGTGFDILKVVRIHNRPQL
jgi:hypothetical protein